MLLARAGINPAIVEDSNDRVHTDQVARLFRLVQQELNDEFMGFTSQPCKYGVFATVCDLVKHSKTLGELLEKVVGFYNLITDAVRMELVYLDNSARLSFALQKPELDVGHFMTEFLMVTWHRFPSWYIGEAIRLRETHFVHPAPEHRKELRIMFPGNLLFSQQANSLFFDSQYLDKPLVRTNRELEAFLANSPSDIMTIPGEDNSLEAQIERTFLRVSSQRLNFPKAEELAEQMSISPLTLYRHLQQEGTSYQKIKDNIRREIAIDKLVNENLSVDEVSEIVGFEEPRSFTRAFKQWTGLSPRNYCKYHRGQSPGY
ncbi:AraC family transcriptional regulator [Porticoccus sp.]